MSRAEVEPERLARDIEAIAAFSEEAPAVGYSRPTFSAPWRRARDYVAGQAELAGCATRVDAAGNLHARAAGRSWAERLWLCGSHVDSVPTGGKFDGVAGVVAALELLRVAPKAPVELIVFAEEEGTTFNLGMLGSRAWAGSLDASRLARLRNRRGEDYLSAGAPHGVVPAELEAQRLDPASYRGLLEVHVEQGPGMWKAGLPVAVVAAIAGRRQYECSLRGEANHAGATSMADRRDALAGAAEAVTALEALGRGMAGEGPGGAVVTVGRLEIEPGAVNVIPGRATFSVDFRAREDAELEGGDGRIRSLLSGIAESRDLELELRCTEKLPAVPMDGELCARLRGAAARLGLELPEATSGALHDTAILAPLMPVAMLFVASKGGISHNPAEFSRVEDLALATRIAIEALKS